MIKKEEGGFVTEPKSYDDRSHSSSNSNISRAIEKAIKNRKCRFEKDDFPISLV